MPGLFQQTWETPLLSTAPQRLHRAMPSLILLTIHSTSSVETVGVIWFFWTAHYVEFSLVALEDFWADAGSIVGSSELVFKPMEAEEDLSHCLEQRPRAPGRVLPPEH